jgi:hypothetical protein
MVARALNAAHSRSLVAEPAAAGQGGGEVLDCDRIAGEAALRVAEVVVGGGLAGQVTVRAGGGEGRLGGSQPVGGVPPGSEVPGQRVRQLPGQRGRPAAGGGADPDRMAQVLANLLDNALRHTPSGGQVRLIAHARVVVLTVGDTGHFGPVSWARIGPDGTHRPSAKIRAPHLQGASGFSVGKVCRCLG